MITLVPNDPADGKVAAALSVILSKYMDQIWTDIILYGYSPIDDDEMIIRDRHGDFQIVPR